MKSAGVEIDSLYEGAFANKSESKRKFISKKLTWISAAAVLIIAILFFGIKYFSGASSSERTHASVSKVSTKPGSRSQLQLPDGSKVWLNASSILTYDEDFGKKLREVSLTGEAFFDVVKDPSHPFIIHTNVMDVKVLGTEFNVKSYPEDKSSEISVIRGSVELTVKNKSQDKIYLKPNEKIVVHNDVVEIEPGQSNQNQNPQKREIFSLQQINYNEIDSTIIETSWVQNRLIFQQNETFREVALKMERWYGVNIRFENEAVAESRVFGSFTTETIFQALDALKEGFKFSYRVNGNEIIISQ
jgi:ferric-dicitrate binding protein FerR (iron transport regulator)